MDIYDIYDRSESLVHHVPFCVTLITHILGQETSLSDVATHNSVPTKLPHYISNTVSPDNFL